MFAGIEAGLHGLVQRCHFFHEVFNAIVHRVHTFVLRITYIYVYIYIITIVYVYNT